LRSQDLFGQFLSFDADLRNVVLQLLHRGLLLLERLAERLDTSLLSLLLGLVLEHRVLQ